MNNTFVKSDYKVNSFSASRIIFDDSDLVSIDVKSRIGGELISTTLMFTFNKFNDLLRFSGESGDKLQLTVSDKLLSTEEKPFVIALDDEPIIFTTCTLEICHIIENDASCFSVEEVTPISFIQQAKNLRMNIADFNDVHLQKESNFNHALNEVATLYRYYIGLKELNLSDDHARQKAGLQNDKLFKIAFYASKSIFA